jgi:hypothetical protein
VKLQNNMKSALFHDNMLISIGLIIIVNFLKEKVEQMMPK